MTTVNSVVPDEDGVLHVRLNIGTKERPKWHRTTVEPGESPDSRMEIVNAHLAALGKQPCLDYSAIQGEVSATHTKERVDRFRAKATLSVLST